MKIVNFKNIKTMENTNTYFLTKSEKSAIVEKVVSEVLSIVGDKKVPYVNLKVQGTFPNEIDWEFIYLGSVSDTKYRLNLDGCMYWDLKIFNPATGHPFEDLRNCEFLTDIFKE